jgi:hypothetical protein
VGEGLQDRLEALADALLAAGKVDDERAVGDPGQGAEDEDDAKDAEGDFVDLNEAEELLRTIRKEDPVEFERIANLRDGIRSARAVFSEPACYVFCLLTFHVLRFTFFPPEALPCSSPISTTIFLRS